jgi:hypothetical protein
MDGLRLIILIDTPYISLSKLILHFTFKTVIKYLKRLEKRCQSLVTVTVAYIKRKIDCMLMSLGKDGVLQRPEQNCNYQIINNF